jgi:CheY-like chemotaxis protein
MQAPTVLVAEDDASIARLLAGYLSRDGYEVEFVEDGQQALERAVSGRPVFGGLVRTGVNPRHATSRQSVD